MKIHNYTLLHELGHGGMAIVYLAEHQLLHNQVAIKVLNKEYVHNENIRKRFLAEARNMFRMSHPNIIKVSDLIEDGDTVAFVMEYIEGETLKESLEAKGKLSDEELKFVFNQMLDAVGYVHEQKLVHRDIKPSNFMVTPSGNVKLMDFGIAKNMDALNAEYTQTGTGIQMGTPMYMSPEQIKSTKAVTNASDIYSLGVVLWQMVAGFKPYDQNELSLPEIQVSILKQALPKTGNDFWDFIIQKSTEKDVEKRFLSCFSIIEELNRTQDIEIEEKVILNFVYNLKWDKTFSKSKQPACKIDELGIEFISVECGTFQMRSTESIFKSIHQVTLDGYYISKYPITQAQWQKVMGVNPSYYSANGDDCPVDNVSWIDCQMFIKKINKQLGCNYRLPTESEWEFAARGGIKSKGFKYSGSDTIEDVTWYSENRHIKLEKGSFWDLSKKEEIKWLGTYPVGEKKPNELGLHDMSGNVWEWCADWFGAYPLIAQTNPKGPGSGTNRVNRGGSWGSNAKYCRISRRNSNSSDLRSNYLGFRLVSPINKDLSYPPDKHKHLTKGMEGHEDFTDQTMV
jgi:serine/threonine protein kinase